MANFFKSLFKSKKEDETPAENGIDKNSEKNFDILKYDGIRAQRMGRIDYAIKCYENALEIEEDFEVMNYLSQIYARLDEQEKAVNLLKQMIRMEPALIDTYLTLSNVYFIHENYPPMLDVLGKAVEIDENNAIAHYLRGKGYKAMKDNEQAIAHLSKAIDLQEDYAEALLNRAEVYTESEQYTEAGADIEKVLQLNDSEEYALLLRAKLNELSEKEADADRDYRLVTELNPFHDQAFIALARLYFNQKKMNEAIAICDEAIELNPESAALYHERGRAKLLSGDKEGSEIDMKLAMQMKAEAEGQVKKQTEKPEEKPSNSLGLPFS